MCKRETHLFLVTLVVASVAQAQFGKPFDVSPASGAQEYPKVSGTRVVWQEYRPQRGDYDIIVADANLPSQDRLVLAIDDVNDQMHPAIWRDTVVWQEYTIARQAQDWDIFLVDLIPDEQGLVYIYPVTGVIGNDEQRPAIYGDTVVWEDSQGHDSDIYGADITYRDDVREFPIAVFDGNQVGPAIWRDQVLWHDDFWGDWDLYQSDILLKNQVTERPLATLPFDQMQVSVADGIAVWQDNTFGDWDIVGADLNDHNDTHFITDLEETADQTNPAVSGEVMVYQDNRNGHWDIYATHLRTGQEQRLTHHKADQINPAISGRLVVWQDNRDGIWTVYALWLDPDFVSPMPPQVNGGLK